MQFQHSRIAQYCRRFLDKWNSLHVQVKVAIIAGIFGLIISLITTLGQNIRDDSHDSYQYSIRIIDYNTGSPIGGAEIYIEPFHIKGITDQDGNFAFQLNSQDIQELTIGVNKSGYMPKKVQIKSGLTNPIVLPISTKIDTL